MPEVDLTPAERARIDELFELVQSGTFFELLGVAPDADAKAVQTAYYEMSRAWHPDRYFRKELGPYRERLETVFATLTRAYRTLTNDTERQRYHRDLEEQGVKVARPRRPRPTTSTGPTPSGAPSPAPMPATSAVLATEAPVEHEAALNRPRPAASIPPTSSAGASPPPSAAQRLGSGIPPRAPSTSLPPRAPSSPIVSAVREQVRERMEKARRYYQTGKEDFEAGRFVKASGALKLALELDPKNETYLKLHEEARAKSRVQQCEHYLKQAQAAFDNMQEPVGIDLLKRAIEYEPADAMPYYRVGKWVAEKENDLRQGVLLLRKAVEKKPDSAEYRIALGDLYVGLKMELNARREYQTVLDRDKKNEKAKAALAKLK